MEHHLRGVNVHHRDVTAKNFSHADRLERSLDGELFFSVGSEERHLVANLQAMAVGKGARKQDGVGLREKHQGIGNLRLRAVELIVAELLITRRVHSQNQEGAFVRKGGLHHGLDHGFRELHAGRSAHSVEHLFGKSGFSGGNLQRRLARQLLHGPAQGIKQGGIAGANREKNGHAKGDAEGG